MLVPWGKTSFFVSLAIAETLGYSELYIHTEVVLLKPLIQHFELCL